MTRGQCELDCPKRTLCGVLQMSLGPSGSILFYMKQCFPHWKNRQELQAQMLPGTGRRWEAGAWCQDRVALEDSFLI